MELIAFNDVENFIIALHARNIIVLGIEGFHIVDDAVIPDMNAIADFSTTSKESDRSISDVRRFVRNVGNASVFFDFTIETRAW